MKIPFHEATPRMMQATVDTARDLCGVRQIFGVQVLLADGTLSICSHNVDKAGLEKLLEAALAQVRSDEALRAMAINGELVAPPGVKPS